MSCAGRFRQVVLRLTALHVFLRIKHSEVLSDNFFGAVTLESRGSGVPTNHISGGIQLENPVFLHTLNQQTEALFAFAQSALGAPLVGDVFEDDAKKIVRQRKNLHGVNSFADALVTVSDFSQMARLLRTQGFEARHGKLRFQEVGKVSQSLAAKILERRTR